jgi:hypothetical protein
VVTRVTHSPHPPLPTTVFTHKDHTAFHAEWRTALGAARVIHVGDVIGPAQTNEFFTDTSVCEVKIAGSKPQDLDE